MTTLPIEVYEAIWKQAYEVCDRSTPGGRTMCDLYAKLHDRCMDDETYRASTEKMERRMGRTFDDIRDRAAMGLSACYVCMTAKEEVQRWQPIRWMWTSSTNGTATTTCASDRS